MRLTLLVGVVVLLYLRHQHNLQLDSARLAGEQLLPSIRERLPNAASLSQDRLPSGVEVLAINDDSGERIGFASRTSPEADHIIGFSGPTDTLLLFDTQLRLFSASVLSSQDTRDHIEQVLQSDFLEQLRGRSLSELRTPQNVDVISGATLTSVAILDSIRARLRIPNTNQLADEPQAVASLKFPDPPNIERARRLFPQATELTYDPNEQVWRVLAEQEYIGDILRSSPYADNAIGYQGPTDTWIAIDANASVSGVTIDSSFDNEPYVGYVRDDRAFRKLFRGRSVSEIAQIDLEEDGIEGVSGATMTSQNAAQGVVLAAIEHSRRMATIMAEPNAEPTWVWEFMQRQRTVRNLSTILLVLLGTVLGLTHWKRTRWLRLLFQCLLIGWLGLVNGDMLSQALLVGWAQNGLPVQNALGLVCLTLVAFVVPISTGKNIYCAHLCPHGAVQQLVRNRLPWRVKLPRRLESVLKLAPVGLLVWVLLVAILRLPFSLVDIEPFDAWLWTITGLASLTIAVVGLVMSLFVPMAYCRYGCPTGRLLEYVRGSPQGKWTHRDTAGVVLFAAGLLLCLLA